MDEWNLGLKSSSTRKKNYFLFISCGTYMRTPLLLTISSGCILSKLSCVSLVRHLFHLFWFKIEEASKNFLKNTLVLSFGQDLSVFVEFCKIYSRSSPVEKMRKCLRLSWRTLFFCTRLCTQPLFILPSVFLATELLIYFVLLAYSKHIKFNSDKR
jgi:hypothetical protein